MPTADGQFKGISVPGLPHVPSGRSLWHDLDLRRFGPLTTSDVIEELNHYEASEAVEAQSAAVTRQQQQELGGATEVAGVRICPLRSA